MKAVSERIKQKIYGEKAVCLEIASKMDDLLPEIEKGNKFAAVEWMGLWEVDVKSSRGPTFRLKVLSELLSTFENEEFTFSEAIQWVVDLLNSYRAAVSIAVLRLVNLGIFEPISEEFGTPDAIWIHTKSYADSRKLKLSNRAANFHKTYLRCSEIILPSI